MNGARSMVPLYAHSCTRFHYGGGLYYSTLVDFSPLVSASARFEEPELKSTNESDAILLFHESHLLFFLFFCFLFSVFCAPVSPTAA